MRAEGLRPATIYSRMRHVMSCARATGLLPHQMTVDAVLAWAASKSWRPETRHATYTSLARFLSWLHGTAVQLPTVRRPRTLARPVPDEIIEAIITGPDDRVGLAARFAAYAGLRRAEIAVVHTSDIANSSILVHGKGGHERIVPLSTRLAASITRYQERHHITGWFFPGGTDGHIGVDRIGKLVNSQLPRPWTLHGLRHRFAGAVYAATKDIIVVQQLLGHASVATTQRYLAFTDEQLRAAVDLADH